MRGGSLRTTAGCIATLAAAALLIGACSAAVLVPDHAVHQDITAAEAGLDRNAAREIINTYRRKHHIQPIQLEDRLTQVAEVHAQTLAEAAQQGGASVPPPLDIRTRLAAAGYRAGEVGEVVGVGHHTIADAFSGWRHSPRHDDIMLMASVREMGIAAVHAPNAPHGVYWVMVVARPL